MYTTHILNNGIKVVMQELAHYRSTSIGVWIKTGSIDETKEKNGISHFIEHMLFKGTETLSAREIAEAFDSIGGDLNAFTSKECTCFHSRVLDHHIDVPIKILSDMIKNPSLRPDDIEKEKSVVLDEIMMAEDTPDDVSYDLIAKSIYEDGTLSRPILGSKETLESFDKQLIEQHLNDYYTTDNMVISVAGSFDEEELMKLLNEGFNMPKTGHKAVKHTNKFHRNAAFIYRDIEQVHLEIGYKGIPYGHASVFDLAALNALLGASVSSRLFQNIREAHGLTYSINSYVSQYEETGLFSIYASMHVKNINKVVGLIRNELDILLTKGISEEELYRVKEQLKGNYILDLESVDSYMNLLGKNTLFKTKIHTPNQVEEKINAITKDSVEALLKDILSQAPTLALVGRVDEDHLNQCVKILGGANEAAS